MITDHEHDDTDGCPCICSVSLSLTLLIETCHRRAQFVRLRLLVALRCLNPLIYDPRPIPSHLSGGDNDFNRQGTRTRKPQAFLRFNRESGRRIALACLEYKWMLKKTDLRMRDFLWSQGSVHTTSNKLFLRDAVELGTATVSRSSMECKLQRRI